MCATKLNGNSCMIIRTIESARVKLCKKVSLAIHSLGSLSSSFLCSEPLLSSFITLHIAGHFYTTLKYCISLVYVCNAPHGTCILLFIVRTHDAPTSIHRPCVILIHTVPLLTASVKLVQACPKYVHSQSRCSNTKVQQQSHTVVNISYY